MLWNDGREKIKCKLWLTVVPGGVISPNCFVQADQYPFRDEQWPGLDQYAYRALSHELRFTVTP